MTQDCVWRGARGWAGQRGCRVSVGFCLRAHRGLHVTVRAVDVSHFSVTTKLLKELLKNRS